MYGKPTRSIACLWWLFMTFSLQVFNKLWRIINSLVCKLYEKKVWLFLLIGSSFPIQNLAKQLKSMVTSFNILMNWQLFFWAESSFFLCVCMWLSKIINTRCWLWRLCQGSLRRSLVYPPAQSRASSGIRQGCSGLSAVESWKWSSKDRACATSLGNLLHPQFGWFTSGWKHISKLLLVYF